MNRKMEVFAELIASAEAAASSFDGIELNRTSQALGTFVEGLLQEPLDAADYQHICRQLVNYRDLCAFLQDTLHGALLRAAGQATPTRYGAGAPSGEQRGPEMVPLTHLQPLLRRYA